jgi:hypothetical protein
MHTPETLLARLDAIGRSLEATGQALALLGMGSVGVELERLDAHSDLDFFAIVQPGRKAAFLADLRWLSDIRPIVYAFQNTNDGFKLLFDDDIFCEFAVLEPQELPNIPFAEGRVVWKGPDVDETIRIPVWRAPERTPPTEEWLIGEALTCLYIGLKRDKRGERLSAQRFIQNYAVDRVLELTAQRTSPAYGLADSFSIERRYEQRYPHLASYLPSFIQGYAANGPSALAILAYLEHVAEVNPVMAERIRRLAYDIH